MKRRGDINKRQQTGNARAIGQRRWGVYGLRMNGEKGALSASARRH